MPPSTDLQNIKIVVVEDRPEIRHLISEFLEQCGANVVAAESALEALSAVRENHPNVVLSDIRMPDRDGFELLRDIRALPPEDGGNVPVIAMTAFTGNINRNVTLAAGFQEHLSKPFGPAKLLEAIDSVLSP